MYIEAYYCLCDSSLFVIHDLNIEVIIWFLSLQEASSIYGTISDLSTKLGAVREENARHSQVYVQFI